MALDITVDVQNVKDIQKLADAIDKLAERLENVGNSARRNRRKVDQYATQISPGSYATVIAQPPKRARHSGYTTQISPPTGTLPPGHALTGWQKIALQPLAKPPKGWMQTMQATQLMGNPAYNTTMMYPGPQRRAIAAGARQAQAAARAQAAAQRQAQKDALNAVRQGGAYQQNQFLRSNRFGFGGFFPLAGRALDMLMPGLSTQGVKNPAQLSKNLGMQNKILGAAFYASIAFQIAKALAEAITGAINHGAAYATARSRSNGTASSIGNLAGYGFGADEIAGRASGVRAAISSGGWAAAAAAELGVPYIPDKNMAVVDEAKVLGDLMDALAGLPPELRRLRAQQLDLTDKMGEINDRAKDPSIGPSFQRLMDKNMPAFDEWNENMRAIGRGMEYMKIALAGDLARVFNPVADWIAKLLGEKDYSSAGSLPQQLQQNTQALNNNTRALVGPGTYGGGPRTGAAIRSLNAARSQMGLGGDAFGVNMGVPL